VDECKPLPAACQCSASPRWAASRPPPAATADRISLATSQGAIQLKRRGLKVRWRKRMRRRRRGWSRRRRKGRRRRRRRRRSRRRRRRRRRTGLAISGRPDLLPLRHVVVVAAAAGVPGAGGHTLQARNAAAAAGPRRNPRVLRRRRKIAHHHVGQQVLVVRHARWQRPSDSCGATSRHVHVTWLHRHYAVDDVAPQTLCGG